MSTPPLKPAPMTEGGRSGIAVFAILAATFAMAFQDATIKLASAGLPLSQIFVIRSIVILTTLPVLALIMGGLGTLRPRAASWTLFRSLLLVLMYVAFYAALPVLDLSTIVAAYYTGPLFIALFSTLLAGDRLTRRQGVALALGFAGVLVILKPGSDAIGALITVPLLAALFYASAAIVTRTKCAAESPLALLVSLNLAFIAVGGLVFAVGLGWQASNLSMPHYPFLLGDWIAMQGREWSVIAVLAAANLAAQYGLARAYQWGAPAMIAALDYSYLIFAAFWSALLLSERPDLFSAAGMLLIAGGGLLLIRRIRPHQPVCPAATGRNSGR